MRAIAVDAGGTNCRLALVTEHGYESVVTDGANATSDLDGAAQAIVVGLESLAEKVNLPLSTLTNAPAYLGVAGVVDSDIAKALKIRLPFERARIEDDRPSALRGALGDQDGFVVHCGTGSFFAKLKNSNASFAGGWGPVLDEIGSAYWIGVQALQFTLYAEDGLQQRSKMTEHFLAEFGGAGSIVAFAKNALPTEIAQLAKTVTDYAQQDDAAAISVLQHGAAVVTEKLNQFGWMEQDAVCLTGGIAHFYKQYLPAMVQDNVVGSKGEPLDGAVALAREFYNNEC